MEGLSGHLLCKPLVLSMARLFPHIRPTQADSAHPSTLTDSLQAGTDRIPHEETLGLSGDLLGSQGTKLPVYRAPTCTVSSDMLATHSFCESVPRKSGGGYGEARGELPLAVKSQSIEQKVGHSEVCFVPTA